VFITSRGTLNKLDSKVRAYLAEKADFLGAIALPSGTFDKNAFTGVDTDIVFLRKRLPGADPAGEAWVKTPEKMGLNSEGEELPYPLNEYYHQHPEMQLGETQLIRGPHRENEPVLKPLEGHKSIADIGRLLDHAISNLPEDAFQRPVHRATEAPPLDLMVPPPGHVKRNGLYFDESGALLRKNVHGLAEAVGTGKAHYPTIEKMLGVRDAYRDILRTQMDPSATDADIAAARTKLNERYDAFVAKHGPFSQNRNASLLEGDPDLPGLLALERFNKESGKWEKADIFEKRTTRPQVRATSAENATEAMAISLNEAGRLNWDRMSELTGKSEADLQAELGHHVYHDPEKGWVPQDEYLSGNVRDKLRAAEAVAKTDPAFQRNVEALKQVVPDDLRPEQISARLGAPYIPVADITGFIHEILEIPSHSRDQLEVRYSEPLAEWFVSSTQGIDSMATSANKWGTNRVPAPKILEAALNHRSPTVWETDTSGSRWVNKVATAAAADKVAEMQEHFAKWVWAEPTRSERIARTYNDAYNSYVLRQHDGSHLQFPGKSELVNFRPHQVNAVWRTVVDGNTLLAHDVGAGKTYVMIAGAMEARRLGVAKKPVIVIPNHMTEQVRNDVLKLYPAANVLAPDEGMGTAAARKKFAETMATGDWDIILLKHSQYELIPSHPDTEAKFIEDQVNVLRSFLEDGEKFRDDERKSRGGRKTAEERTNKQVEKSISNLTAKLERLRAKQFDDGITWEDLGVDHLSIDEADRYKNLYFPTKMGRIKGVQQGDAQRSIDNFLKINTLLERNNGRTVVLATGTPINNSMTEMYTMMRYLMPERLKQLGLEHFDNWAGVFAEQFNSLEVGIEGKGFKQVTRLGFHNLPELATMFRSVADVKQMDMPEMAHVRELLPAKRVWKGAPGEEGNTVVRSVASKSYLAYVNYLSEVAEKVRASPRDYPGGMLVIGTAGRKASLDMRLVSPSAEFDPGGKVGRMLDNVHDVWKESKPDRGVQLIFSDLGTPSGNGFNLYEDIRQRLVAKGIPREEIAFIHEYKGKGKDRSEELFEKVRSGKVRVVLASTEMMGTGTNVQDRLVGLHHLDVPWKPSVLTQREGRIVRQGNLYRDKGGVYIFNYVTEGANGTAGFDTFMWQTVEAKARMVNQAMRSDPGIRSYGDMDDEIVASAAMLKAIATGDPRYQESVVLDAKLEKLGRQRSNHLIEQQSVQYKLRNAESDIKLREASLAVDRRLWDKTEKILDDRPALVIGGKEFEKTKEAGRSAPEDL
jgi:N12 class adenine-specific DNA methylase